MGARLWAVGIGLVLLGGYLLVTPITTASATTFTLVPGTWADIGIPTTASITGGSVHVVIGWGTVLPCPGPGYGLFCNSPYPSYLTVFDCGPSSCDAQADHPQVGATPLASGGTADFPALPGHHYQLWAWYAGNPASAPPIPVRYQIAEPLLGGFLGLGLIGSGIVVLAAATARATDPTRAGTILPDGAVRHRWRRRYS